MGLNPKFYILNSINNQKENSSSGGVEATITKKSRIVRLSISPSQGLPSSPCEHKTTTSVLNIEGHSHNNDECSRLNNFTNGNNIESKIEAPNFWDSFKTYLKGVNNEKTIYTRISHARRCSYLLIKDNFNELHTFSNDVRNHIMKSLAALSKFLGMYDKWKVIVEKFNLKWSSEFNGLDAFKKIIN